MFCRPLTCQVFVTLLSATSWKIYLSVPSDSLCSAGTCRLRYTKMLSFSLGFIAKYSTSRPQIALANSFVISPSMPVVFTYPKDFGFHFLCYSYGQVARLLMERSTVYGVWSMHFRGWGLVCSLFTVLCMFGFFVFCFLNFEFSAAAYAIRRYICLSDVGYRMYMRSSG